MLYMPYVIEKSARGEYSSDIFSRLLKDRIIFLTGEITDVMANLVIAHQALAYGIIDKVVSDRKEVR